MPPKSSTTLSADQAIAALWKRGQLRYKLLPHQRGLYAELKHALWGDGGYTNPNGAQRKFFPELHRKYGKSTLCGIIACELALQKPGAIIYWAAETSIQVRRFLLPIMNTYVLNDCPQALRPEWKDAKGEFHFPNGSVIILGGCDDESKCNRLRGPACDLFIADEAGQIGLLDYLYKSVVLWMVSRSGGRVLFPSTPATSPGHPYTRMCIAAEHGEDGAYARRVIWDSNLPPELVEELARECGGTDTAAWKREALCERVVDATRAVLPEFGAAKAVTVEAIERPEYFTPYVSADIGLGRDPTGVLFGYYDFKRALMVVEDELILGRMTTDVFAAAVIEKEQALWGAYWDKLERENPWTEPDIWREPRRFGDLNDLVVSDLIKNHALTFTLTAKHDKHSAINEWRIWIKTSRTRIHPRCKQLIAQCEAGIWDRKHREYERIDGFGHFELLDCGTYMRRNIDEQRNPFPAIPIEMRDHPERYHIRPTATASPLQSLADMFTPKNVGA